MTHYIAVVFLTLFSAPFLFADIFPEENQSVELDWPETCYITIRLPWGDLRLERPCGVVPIEQEVVRRVIKPLRDSVDLYYSDKILNHTLCDTDHAGIYAEHCNQYELVVVPFSVSVYTQRGTTRIKRLRVYAKLHESSDEIPSKHSIITSVFPSSKKETQELETASVTVESGLEGPIFKSIVEV